MIEVLEKALEMARSGQIRAVVVVTQLVGREASSGCAIPAAVGSFAPLIAELEVMKIDLVMELIEADKE